MNNKQTIQAGDKVLSMAYGTVGYVHHVNDRGNAWVVDQIGEASGQYYKVSDLQKLIR